MTSLIFKIYFEIKAIFDLCFGSHYHTFQAMSKISFVPNTRNMVLILNHLIFQMDKFCQGRTDEMLCLLEKRQTIESDSSGSTCKRYLKSMAVVFFSDYHLIHGFVDKCADDVKKLNCGMLSNAATDETTTSQVFLNFHHC